MKSSVAGQVRHGILRWLVGGVFVFAGALKVAGPAKFVLDIGNYRLVPPGLTNLVAILIPWLELTAGLFVLAGCWLRAAALVLASLTAVFFAVIVSALVRGLNIECGCFGTVGGRHIGLVNLTIDTTLFVLSAWLARHHQLGSAKLRSEKSGSRNAGPVTLPSPICQVGKHPMEPGRPDN